jgi:hypothetical protein
MMAQHGVGVVGVAQVSGAVERVQACHDQIGRVADVVQPRGCFQEISVSAENRRQTACPCGDALDVRPAAREGIPKECQGEMFRPRSQRLHVTKARQAIRDVHGRGVPSEDVLFIRTVKQPCRLDPVTSRPSFLPALRRCHCAGGGGAGAS